MSYQPLVIFGLALASTCHGLSPLRRRLLDSCETAYANFGGDDDTRCFLDDGFSRWGWTHGPITIDVEGGAELSSDMYAGAAQCDLDKGELVGSFSININIDGTFTAELNPLSGFSFNEFHLYIGTTSYPQNNGKDTVAPGQYTFQTTDESASISDEIENFDIENEYYVIAHAVSCGSSSETVETTQKPVTTLQPVTTSKPQTTAKRVTTAKPVSTQKVVTTLGECNNYVVLSGWDWAINDVSSSSIDGTYILTYDSGNGDAPYSFIREDGSYEIVFILAGTDNFGFDSYYVEIWDLTGQRMDYISYFYESQYWNNDVNPLIEDDSNPTLWEAELELTRGDVTMYDCDGNDVGTDLCLDNDVSLFAGVYYCEEGLPTISKGGRIGNTMSVWMSLIVAIMIGLLKM